MKEKNGKKIEYDPEQIIKKEKDFDEFMTCAICSIGFSSATASIISLITGCIDRPETLPYFIAGGILATPAYFILTKKLRQKMDEKFKKDIVSASNLLSMMGEVFNQDRIIDENTSVFLNELELKFQTNDLSIPTDVMFCINKLLYLVNLNYYDEISKNISTLTREKLMDHIMNQIVSYYKSTDKRTFDEIDASEIINYCLLIRPEIKEQIIKEFKASKVKIGNNVDYAIAKKGVTEVDELDPMHNFVTKATSSGYNFDITSESDLNTVILAATESKHIRQYGNPETLNWDMDFLNRVLTLIASNYRQQLIEYHEDYSNLALASSFITNAITYALVNKREEVGQREMISTFKNWRYVPFNMQDQILTKLFEEDGIDYSLHPYRIRKDPTYSKRAKIIQIRDNFFKKNSTTEE